MTVARIAPLSSASYDWSKDRVECCRREATGLAGASDPSAGPVCTPTRHATTGRCVSKEPWMLAMARAYLDYPATPANTREGLNATSLPGDVPLRCRLQDRSGQPKEQWTGLGVYSSDNERGF